MYGLRRIGTVAVDHYINISIHAPKHCLDHEAFALSWLRQNVGPGSECSFNRAIRRIIIENENARFR